MDSEGPSTGRLLSLGALAAAVILALPVSAWASYAPKLAVSLSPTDQPGAQIALTSTVTQASDEDPTAKAIVHFPVGIGFDVAALGKKTACSPAQRDARQCPDTARLGTATAQALGQTLTGGVYLGESATVYIFLHNDALALLGQDPKPITAKTVFRPDGGTDTVLDDLPHDFTATQFTLALDGPPNSVLDAPSTCGAFQFSGDFTSSKGATASAAAGVNITGCQPDAVALSRVRLSSREVRRGRRVRLSFNLNRDARVEVSVRRVDKRRILSRKRLTEGAGAAHTTLRTRALRAGSYVIRVKATAAGQTSIRNLILRVTEPPRRHR